MSSRRQDDVMYDAESSRHDEELVSRAGEFVMAGHSVITLPRRVNRCDADLAQIAITTSEQIISKINNY